MNFISFEPLISVPLWGLIAVLAIAAGSVYAYHARARLATPVWKKTVALMSVSILLPLVILLNPTWLERIPPPPGEPRLTVLVDTSASMAAPNAGTSETRYANAAQYARQVADQLQGRWEVRLRTFSDQVVPVDAAALPTSAPAGETTDLARAIRESLQEDHPAGQAIVLLSDGIPTHEGGASAALEEAQRAKAMTAPVFARTIGGEATVTNLAVQVRSPQELGFVEQQVPIAVRLVQQGLDGRTCTVSLWDGEEEIEQQQVTLAGGKPTDVIFAVQPAEVGVHQYEIRASRLGAETIELDNRASMLVRVVDRPIRVLLLEGKPYWDSKFLMRNLAADPSIELVSMVRMADDRILKRTLTRVDSKDTAKTAPDKTPVVDAATAPAALPGVAAASIDGDEATSEPAQKVAPQVARTEQWEVVNDADAALGGAGALDDYQIVVLGRDAEVFLGDAAMVQLRAWLARDGGALVCALGAPTAQTSDKLGQLLPVRWQPAREARFRVRLTAEGKELHWLSGAGDADEPLAGMPSLAAAFQPGQPAPLSVVLATRAVEGSAESIPVVTYRLYGTGRTVVVEGAGMWRWAFRPPEYAEQEAVYSTLWQSLVRWLAARPGLLPGEQLALQSDKGTFAETERATATLLLREDATQQPLPIVHLNGDALSAEQETTPRPVGDEPGVYRVDFGSLPQGRYRAEIAAEGERPSTTLLFDVRPSFEERLRISARPDIMQRIAEESGGSVLEKEDSAELIAKLDEHLRHSRPERIVRHEAWDNIWVMLGVLGVWGVTWGYRRSSGLI